MSELFQDMAQELKLTHTALEIQFTAGRDEDEKLARQLEEFLNYVVYNKIPPSNIFDEFLTKDIADKMKQNKSLINLFTSNSTKLAGKKGEKAFSLAILEMLKSIQPEILPHTIETNLKKISQMGNISATIISQEIIKKEMARMLQLLNSKKSIRKFSSWDARQGKIDVDVGRIEIVGEPNALAKKLLNITASVKNYSSFSVHLETVNRQKAFLSILSEIRPDLPKTALDSIWSAYNLKNRGNAEDIEAHLQHMSNIYALTGYGQKYLDKTQKNAAKIIADKYARFLMINKKGDGIKIKSTKAIVLDEVLNSKGKSGFTSRFSESKGRHEISYNA